jgi:tetratricopeptide (TPR) repeat protein
VLLRLAALFVRAKEKKGADDAMKRFFDELPSNAPPDKLAEAADICIRNQNLALAARAMEAYVRVDPGNWKAWLNLGALNMALRKKPETFAALETAVQIGGEAARDVLRRDERFEPIRKLPEFRKLTVSRSAVLGPLVPIPGLPGSRR